MFFHPTYAFANVLLASACSVIHVQPEAVKYLTGVTDQPPIHDVV